MVCPDRCERLFQKGYHGSRGVADTNNKARKILVRRCLQSAGNGYLQLDETAVHRNILALVVRNISLAGNLSKLYNSPCT